MDMAITRPLGQTSAKPFDQHVLELPTAALSHPSTIPSLLAHSTARSRRSSAGQFTAEHLVCVHCSTITPTDRHHPEPPDRHSTRHSAPTHPQARARDGDDHLRTRHDAADPLHPRSCPP